MPISASITWVVNPFGLYYKERAYTRAFFIFIYRDSAIPLFPDSGIQVIPFGGIITAISSDILHFGRMFAPRSTYAICRSSIASEFYSDIPHPHSSSLHSGISSPPVYFSVLFHRVRCLVHFAG